MRKLSAIILFFSIFISSSFALADSSSDAVNQFVSKVSEDVIDILNSKSSDEAKLNNLTNKFQNTVDIKWIAKFVIGKHWTTLSLDEKNKYLQNYTDFLTSSYVPVFKDYNGQKINILDTKYIGSGYYIVRTSIIRDNSTVEYIVEYRVKDLKGDFKVRDIIAEGVSMISTQRSEFSSVISSSGLASLNKQLIEKAEK